MAKHDERMAVLIEQLRSIKTNLDDFLVIDILVSFIEVLQMLPVTAVIKTLT